MNLKELEKYLKESIRIIEGAIECPLSSNSEIKEMLIEKKIYFEILNKLKKEGK